MEASFEPYKPLLWEVEGTTLDLDRRDNGNWTGGKVGVGEIRGTKYGIDCASHPGEDIANMTEARAVAIYKAQYARPIHFNELPPGVDVVLLDPAINNGVSRATKFAQAEAGVDPIDGNFGPKTLAAVQAHAGVAFIQAVSARRLAFDQGLTSLWRTYGGGWTKRIAKIEAFCVNLFLTMGKGYTPEVARERMEQEADGLAAEAKKNRDKAATAGTGGAIATGAGGGAVPDVSGLPPRFAMVAIGAAVAIVVIYYLWHRHVAATRANAYAAAAKGG